MENKSIIIFGPPRSGTTWLASIIALAGFHIIHEPDNGKNSFTGWVFQNNLRRFPYFNDSDKPNSLIHLFKIALKENYHPSNSKTNSILFKIAQQNKESIERSLQKNEIYKVKCPNLNQKLIKLIPGKIKLNNQPRALKSVHSFLSLPFLMKNLDFIPLIIVRHPCAVIHSMKSIGMPDINRQVFNDPKIRQVFLKPYMTEISKLKSDYEYAGLQIGIFHYILNTYTKKYKYSCIKHEDLVLDPINKFKSLFEDLNLGWKPEIEKKLMEKNKEGSGYDLHRDVSTVNEKWKLKLTGSEIEEINNGYSIFPDLFYKDLSR